MIPHGVFDAASHSKRGLSFAAGGHEAGGVCVNDHGSGVIKGDAKLGIQKKAVKRCADAARDQAVAGADLGRIAHAAEAARWRHDDERLGRATFDLEIPAFAFDAENKPVVGLPVAPRGAASDRLVTETEVPGADAARSETI